MTRTIDNLDFIKDVKKRKVIFLFGTGITAALTGRPFSWKRWLEDGLESISDKEVATQLHIKLNKSESAQDYIIIANEIITRSKNCDEYHKWMNKSFSEIANLSAELSETLKRLLLSQSLFITTNYDTALEKATGCNTLTYDEPSKVFTMIENWQTDKIFHIHGAYEPSMDLDNIVANAAQYDHILNNKGTQFLQNLLSTSTIILVGCGKTTDDPNISQFISFASEHLGLNSPKYILCRNDDMLDDALGLLTRIEYGDDYDDLPIFLDKIASLRLEALMESNPLVGLLPEIDNPTIRDPLAKYHFAQQIIPFTGRSAEIKLIHSFIISDCQFSWIGITGQAGAGKSRLGFEAIKQKPAGWFAFFLNSDITSDEAVKSFVPFSNTIIVIDYIAGRERIIASIIKALRNLFLSSQYSLKLILIERDNSRKTGSWISVLESRMGRDDARWFISAEFNQGNFIDLGDLDDESVIKMISEICRMNELAPDIERDKILFHTYKAKAENLRFRPLYVQIFIDAWIMNDFMIPRFDKFEDLLEEILKREQSKWLGIFKDRQDCCNAFIHLLLRANITGKLEKDMLPDLYADDWTLINDFIKANTFPGYQRTEYEQNLIAKVCQDIETEGKMISPMFPDLIKEFMFSYYMEEERMEAVFDELWQNASTAFHIFIRRCMKDFPENKFYRKVLDASYYKPGNVKTLLGRSQGIKLDIHHDCNEDYDTLLQQNDLEYEFWSTFRVSDDIKTAVEENITRIGGLYACAMFYGKLGDIETMKSVINEIIEVKADTEGSFLKASLLQDCIAKLGKSGLYKEAEWLKDKLIKQANELEDPSMYILFKMQADNTELIPLLINGKTGNAVRKLREMHKVLQNTNYDNQEDEIFINEASRIFLQSCITALALPYQHGYHIANTKAIQEMANEVLMGSVIRFVDIPS